jgi:hypothetical protein
MKNVVCSLVALASLTAAPLFAQDAPPPHPPHGPPSAEMIAACNGLANGAACTVTKDGVQTAGICHTGPQGEAAACFTPHHHQIPPEAFAACQNLAENAACTVTVHDHTMNGTCTKAPQGDALVCHPPHHAHQ